MRRKSKTAKRDHWEQTVGREIVNVYEEGLRRHLGDEGAEDYLRHREGEDNPISNLRRKRRAS